MVALVSPMDDGGQLDERSFRRLLDHQTAGGVGGVVIGGTTGESPCLLEDELAWLITLARRHLPASITVIAGSGSNSTARAVALTRRVFDAGADACMVVTPFYNKPPQAGLRRHYEAVADAANGPVILYNVPSRTGCDLLPETVAQLAALERVTAVKEAVPDMVRVRELVSRCGGQLDVLSGDDPTLVDALGEGASGAVSVTGNVAPSQLSSMVSSGIDGRLEDAREVDAPLRDLHRALFAQSNPIAVKWALARMGIIASPALRLPLVPLDPAYHQQVERALANAGLLSS